jgi:hypothetical protein
MPGRENITLPQREWFRNALAWDEHQRALQNRHSYFLLTAYGILLAATMPIFYFQGFRMGGFHLELSTLNWIGGATVGQIAGLATLTWKAVFGPGSGSRMPREEGD